MADTQLEVQEREGLFARWVGDGRPLLAACCIALMFGGGFAIFVALAGDFLPHDVHYLGMTAGELCEVQCRIVDFMIHDRASWGGTLVGIGVLYLWLVTFPLSSGERWAWWTVAVTGAIGFATFLSYLGYGYLDTWHGLGTLFLLPVFVWGLIRSRRVLNQDQSSSIGSDEIVSIPRDRVALGRLVLMLGAAGTFLGGSVILTIGVTNVFVPEDIEFIGFDADQMSSISPRLVPLIAHDRAGFGGAVAVMGLTTLACLWFGGHSRSLLQAIGLAGAVALGSTFIIHFAVGYENLWHLAPPAIAAASLVAGELLAYPGKAAAR